MTDAVKQFFTACFEKKIRTDRQIKALYHDRWLNTPSAPTREAVHSPLVQQQGFQVDAGPAQVGSGSSGKSDFTFDTQAAAAAAAAAASPVPLARAAATSAIRAEARQQHLDTAGGVGNDAGAEAEGGPALGAGGAFEANTPGDDVVEGTAAGRSDSAGAAGGLAAEGADAGSEVAALLSKAVSLKYLAIHLLQKHEGQAVTFSQLRQTVLEDPKILKLLGTHQCVGKQKTTYDWEAKLRKQLSNKYLFVERCTIGIEEGSGRESVAYRLDMAAMDKKTAAKLDMNLTLAGLKPPSTEDKTANIMLCYITSTKGAELLRFVKEIFSFARVTLTDSAQWLFDSTPGSSNKMFGLRCGKRLLFFVDPVMAPGDGDWLHNGKLQLYECASRADISAVLRSALGSGEGRSAAQLFKDKDYDEFVSRMDGLGWAWANKGQQLHTADVQKAAAEGCTIFWEA